MARFLIIVSAITCLSSCALMNSEKQRAEFLLAAVNDDPKTLNSTLRIIRGSDVLLKEFPG